MDFTATVIYVKTAIVLITQSISFICTRLNHIERCLNKLCSFLEQTCRLLTLYLGGDLVPAGTQLTTPGLNTACLLTPQYHC